LGGATKAIWVNGKFIVDYDGTVSATAGTIGGWTIGNISGGGNYLHKTKSGSGTINLGGSDYAMFVNGGVFKVGYDGVLTATNANVSGTITSSNATITGGNITIKNGNSIFFKADSSGVTVNGTGSFSGDVTANTLSANNANGISMGGSTFYRNSISVITGINLNSDKTIKNIEYETIYFISTEGTGTPTIGCFVAGTKISMANGTFKNIEDI
jgi:hypothetical protein